MSVKDEINRWVNKFKNTVDNSLSVSKMKEVGEHAVSLVQARTQMGYGVKEKGAKKERLKKLSPKYVEYRKDKQQYLHEFARPNKSNLTFTGQLIESLTVISAKIKSVIVGPSGTRDDGLSNAEVAEHVSKTRPFLNLSDLEIKQVALFIRKLLNDMNKS